MKYTLLILLIGCIAVFACKNKQKTSQQVVPQDTPEKVKADNTKDRGDRYILFYGNSLTAGYGVEEEESYPYLIQERLDSMDLKYTVINAGLSGETTAGGLSRIDWVLRQKIDIFLLELGGNDLLRGLEVKSTEENLRGILQKVRDKYPDIPIILAGMQAPPNMGNDYTEAFAAIYPTLAKEFNIGLIPFFLENVGGRPQYNQKDGIHPNPAGQKIVVENVWQILKNYLDN
jgi:acyl-CoA thioesterase-1